MQESVEWQSPLGDRGVLCVYYKCECVCVCVCLCVCALLTEEEQRLIEAEESR